MRGRVMVEFCGGKELHPFSQVIGTEDAEVCFKFLIGSLSLTISLGMISGGKANIILEEMSKLLGEGRSTLRTMIIDESVV